MIGRTEVIRAALVDRKVSPGELASRAGVSRSTVYYLEHAPHRGSQEATVDKLWIAMKAILGESEFDALVGDVTAFLSRLMRVTYKNAHGMVVTDMMTIGEMRELLHSGVEVIVADDADAPAAETTRIPVEVPPVTPAEPSAPIVSGEASAKAPEPPVFIPYIQVIEPGVLNARHFAKLDVCRGLMKDPLLGIPQWKAGSGATLLKFQEAGWKLIKVITLNANGESVTYSPPKDAELRGVGVGS